MPSRYMCRAVLVSMLICCGCGQGDEPTSTRLGGLSRLVSDYLIANRGTFPKDQQALSEFAAGLDDSEQILDDSGVDTIEELFQSEHDGQPFKLLLGDERDVEYGVVAYQVTAIEGQRWVGFRTGVARIVPESEFQDMGLE